MKYLILTLALVTIQPSYALTFKGDVKEDELLSALRQGKGSVNGKKIVIKPGSDVPSAMKTKWMERQLSGADAPTEGAASPDVIFVEAF